MRSRSICATFAGWVDAALDEGRDGDWTTFEQRLNALSGRVGRFTAMEDHEARHAALVELRRVVENTYLDSLDETELSANDGQGVRHIQNSNPRISF